jgi:hypothetical protein
VSRKVAALRHHATGAAFLLALAVLGCGESYDGVCWMGVDTVYVSGVRVENGEGAREALDRLAAHVDTSAAYPDGYAVQFVWARYYWTFQHRRYWLLHTREFLVDPPIWFESEVLFVDENGVIVHPLGCI